MIVNPQPEDCSRCHHTLCMTLAEDTIYNVQERLCADTKDVVGSKNNLKPDIRSAFVVRRCLIFISHTAAWCWSVKHAIVGVVAYMNFIKNVKDNFEKGHRLSYSLK